MNRFGEKKKKSIQNLYLSQEGKKSKKLSQMGRDIVYWISIIQVQEFL